MARRFKDPGCHCCDSAYCCGTGLIPRLGTSGCSGRGQKRKENVLIHCSKLEAWRIMDTE